MSSNPLVKMREMQNAMRELETAMQALQADPSLRLELEFESDLQALLAKYDKTIHEAVQVVDPSFRVVEYGAKRTYKPKAEGHTPGATGKGTRNSAPIFYLFKNPHTGEEVRSANILKKEVQVWINQYGKDEVLKWRSKDEASA
jgi:hypothetical protein